MILKDQNILFIVRTMGLGGTENVVLQLCEILSGKVNKIIVCSAGGVHESTLKNMGIRHYKIPDISSKKPIEMQCIYSTIKKIIKKEHITIVHSHHRMAAMYAELASPPYIIKVANAHNTFKNKKFTTRFAYRDTKLIAVGEMVKKNLVDYFKISEDQIQVIHNAVKPFDGNIQPIDILQKERLEGNTLIGDIGRLSEQKGMCYFIEAAEKVLESYPHTKFFIVGDGELKNELVELTEKKHLEQNIFFLGYRNDIQNVMSQLDFIVLSSLWEGLPLTPIEAFSVGKTIVATKVDGTLEIVKHNKNGLLCKPQNIDNLSGAIMELLENTNKRNWLAENAMKSYKNNFDFQTMKNRYLSYYKIL